MNERNKNMVTLAVMLSLTAAVFYKPMKSILDKRVAINGELYKKITLPQIIEVALKGEGLKKIWLEKDSLISLYKTAKESQDSNRLTFVKPSQIKSIADVFLKRSGNDKIRYIEEVLTFVNDNVSYTEDMFSYYHPILGSIWDLKTDFPKFPIQTLLDKSGDCEDYSILIASFFAYAGIKTSIAYSPGHAAVAFEIEDDGGLTRKVIEAANNAMGKKVNIHLDPPEIVSNLTVSTTTKAHDLEDLIEGNLPTIMGHYFETFVTVKDKKVKSIESDEKRYWNGNFEITFSYLDRPDSTIQPRTLSNFNDLLHLASARMSNQKSQDEVIFEIPGLRDHYLTFTPQFNYNLAGGSFFVEMSDEDERTLLSLIGEKSNKIFYLEPYQKGLNIHTRIPHAVTCVPLPKEAYLR